MATNPNTMPPANDSGSEAPPGSLSRLWQLPFFLLALAAFLYVFWQRPLQHHDSGSRQFDRELAYIRTLLTRSETDVPTALKLAERAHEQVVHFPDRTGEVAFLLGSAHLRQAELIHDSPRAREHLTQARKQLELASTETVPENDRARSQYRLARSYYLLEESPDRVVQLLSAVVEKADSPAEGYQMLSRAYLRLPQPDLRAALAANERLRQVPLAGEEVLATARLEAGELLLQLAQADEARKVLEKVGPQAPAHTQARARWLRAQSFQDDGRFPEAATLWQQAVADAREPTTNRGRIYYNLGFCYRRMDQVPDAVRAWEQCLAEGSGVEQQAAAVLLAELQLQENQGEKARVTLEAALRGIGKASEWNNPLVPANRISDLCERAIQTLSRTQLELAISWTQVYQRLAKPGRAEQLRGDLLAQAGHDALAQAAKSDPATAAPLKEKGTHQLREAARAYASAAQIHADANTRADLYWNAANLALETQDRDAGTEWLIALIHLFDQPAELGPKSASALPGALERKARAWYLLAETLRLSNSPKAEEAYRNCRNTATAPFTYRAQYRLAMYSLARGEVDDAEATLRQNLHMLRFENDREAQEQSLFALGGIYYHQNKYHEVVRILEEALGRFPANPEATRAHLQLAQSYRQLSAQQNLTALTNLYKTEESRTHFAREHRRWLTKAAEEFSELAGFLETAASAGHLTQEERAQIPFTAAACRFDLGEYKTALEIYNHLAERHKGTDEALNALGGAVRCHAALGQNDLVRQRLTEIRSQLAQLDESVRRPWEAWLTIASKPATEQEPRSPNQPKEPTTSLAGDSNKPRSTQPSPSGAIAPDRIDPGQPLP